MRDRFLYTLSVVAVIALIATGAASAAGSGASVDLAGPSFGDPGEYLLQDGWEVVGPEVMRRDLGEGRVETWAYGVRGLAWAVNHLAQELAMMEADYAVAPSGDLWDAIQTHRELLASTEENLDRAVAEGGQTLQEMALPSGCDISWGYHANAYPGATAQADSYFYNTCSYVANTYAYAYVRTTKNGVTTTKSQTDPSGPGTNISSYAYASLSGTADSCYAYARAYVNSTDFGYFQVTDSDSLCNPLTVSISGSSYVFVPSSCKTYTWTANPSGGTGSYTNYAWTYNGSSVGSNSSTYSRTYCATRFWTYRTDTVGVTVTDSSGATAPASRNISVELGPTDPCLEPFGGEGPTGQALPEPCLEPY